VNSLVGLAWRVDAVLATGGSTGSSSSSGSGSSDKVVAELGAAAGASKVCAPPAKERRCK
jgi:hypothetical protein